MEFSESDVRVKPLGQVKKISRLISSKANPGPSMSCHTVHVTQYLILHNIYTTCRTLWPNCSPHYSSTPLFPLLCSHYSSVPLFHAQPCSRRDFAIPHRAWPQLDSELRCEIVRDLVTHMYSFVGKPIPTSANLLPTTHLWKTQEKIPV